MAFIFSSSFKISQISIAKISFFYTFLGNEFNVATNKTHQHYDQIHSVVLPHISNSVLYPITAVTEMFSRIPALPSDMAFGY